MKQKEIGILYTGNKKVDYMSPKVDSSEIENIGKEIMGRNWRKLWLENRNKTVLNNCVSYFN